MIDHCEMVKRGRADAQDFDEPTLDMVFRPLSTVDATHATDDSADTEASACVG